MTHSNGKQQTMTAFGEANDAEQLKAAQANHWAQRQVKREDRIAILQENEGKLSESEQKELQGLLIKQENYVEQYSSADFTEAHSAFKDAHNHIFLKLCLHCQEMRESDINVFYLDGPDAGTTKTLTSMVDIQQCYTANRHESTCQALRDEGLVHVAHDSAKDALSSGGAFDEIDFHAYYFDGCGGYTPHIIEMIQAAIRPNATPPIAVGFSILGGGRDCVDKEQDVIRSLVQKVKPMGFRVDHVGDDPGMYGIDKMKKVESSALTTWCMIVGR